MEEEIKLLEEKLKIIESLCTDDCINKSTVINPLKYAVENLITRYKQYEQKLMFALSPTTHELALETQRNFKRIIVQNIDEDTYTIRRELKKYWDNKDTYWKEYEK